MSTTEKREKVKFNPKDCSVNGVLLDTQDSALGVSRFPKFGLPGVHEGVLKQPSDLNGISVVHVPTGMMEFEDRFTPNRNKTIAMARLKERVEAFIKEKKLND